MKILNWKGYRIIAWIGQALLTIFVIAAAVQGKWSNALGLALFLVISFVFVIRDDKLPTLFDFLFVLAALLNATGWVWNLFGIPGPYDEIVHGYTTFAITLALSFLVYSSMLNIFRNHTLLYIVTITSFGIAIGALWEVTEWSAGKILSTQVIESLDDTIIDLVMDTLGAGLAALISLWALRNWTNRNAEANHSQTETYI
ncbi:hypothetical protein GNF10_20110 [Nostoc sp. UCD121]|uniref:hypothetical protein n=1 Tax=unclassified Nostoc TaxID=2593658 RepID=UPI0016268097|nr:MULTISPECIES: hypothetical protein [unclassified Nostoc]MBC1224918.1 hypothetical protein [Nostoc sp. UCD120]MBC1278204.1 hypothetical protein [Nostoc sp. UCD121]MBC1296006.1 hypothetical protein [Nostoc sp. UCD122]